MINFPFSMRAPTPYPLDPPISTVERTSRVQKSLYPFQLTHAFAQRDFASDVQDETVPSPARHVASNGSLAPTSRSTVAVDFALVATYPSSAGARSSVSVTGVFEVMTGVKIPSFTKLRLARIASCIITCG